MKRQSLCLLICCITLGACYYLRSSGPIPENNKELEQWFAEGKWNQGWRIDADESINKKEFAFQYFKNQDQWDKAFHFLSTTDLKKIELGRYELDGTNLYVIVDEYQTKNEEDTRFEAHREYADIQYLVVGQEQIGVISLQKTEILVPYDKTNDISFLKANENNYRLANSSKFFVFFPDDAHRPGIKVGDSEIVKKIVIKVKI